MAAGLYDITIEQGADFNLSFVWKQKDGTPHNLTGCHARMQIRESVAAKAKIFDLSTDNGKISFTIPTAGVVSVNIPATLSASVTVAQTKLVWKSEKQGVVFAYDLEIVQSDGVVRRLLQGSAFFVPEVTR